MNEDYFNCPHFDWGDLVPNGVALAQIAWERHRLFARMKDIGFSVASIARSANRSHSVITGHIAKARLRPLSPVELWMSQGGELEEFAQAVRGKYWNSRENRWTTRVGRKTGMNIWLTGGQNG